MTDAAKPRTIELRIRLSLADADAVLDTFKWMDAHRESVAPLYTGPVQNFRHAMEALIENAQAKERRRKRVTRRKTTP